MAQLKHICIRIGYKQKKRKELLFKLKNIMNEIDASDNDINYLKRLYQDEKRERRKF